MNTRHQTEATHGEAAAHRRLADLLLFAAGYFLAGPDERSHALLTDPAWLAGLRRARLLGRGIEVRDPTTVSSHRQQFAELFRIPSDRYVAPVEQAFRDAKATVDDSAVGECLAVYQAAGYELAPYAHIQADHLGHQLRFVHAVLTREADCLERGDTAAAATVASWRRGFLADHGRWWRELAQRTRSRNPCAAIRHAVSLAERLGHTAAEL